MQTEYFKNKILPLKNKLFRKALSITESAVEAENVVQDVMMHLWEQRADWTKIGNMEVYCMVLTKNRALDVIKRSGRNNDSIDDENIRVLQSETEQPLENTVLTDMHNWLWKLIKRLPEKQQEIIRLRDMEEMSYQEIAEEVNLSESQVKVTLFRARKKIKEMYLQIDNYGL